MFQRKPNYSDVVMVVSKEGLLRKHIKSIFVDGEIILQDIMLAI